MALFKQKPLDQLSPSYRKRIERGLAKGLSRSQSRGHPKKSELNPRQQLVSAFRENNTVLRGIKLVAEDVGYNDPTVQNMIYQFNKVSTMQNHKTTEARNIMRSIQQTVREYFNSGEEDLDFRVEGWY